MSDIGTDAPPRDVDKAIIEALKAWEECGFKDMSLWETFQEDFEGFTEEDFKLASNHNIRKLRDYLQKLGVWVRKQQRYTIAGSLYDALLEEEPTDWTETEIIACEEKEEFASYQISRLIDSDFGRKPRKSRALTPTSPTGPPPAPAPLASPSPTPGPSAPVPAYTPIHHTQPSSIRPTPAAYGMQRSGARPSAYMQPSGTASAACMQPSGPTSAAYIQPSRPTSATYMQPSGTGPTPAVNTTLGVHNQPAYTPLSGTEPTPGEYMQPPGPGLPPTAYTLPGTGLTPAVYILPSGTGPTFAVHTQPSGTGPAHAIQTPPSAINPPAAMTLTSTGHVSLVDPQPAMTHTSTGHASLVDPQPAITSTSTGPERKLSNLAKTYTNEATYSGWNNSFIFQLANPWKDALNSLPKNFRMGRTSGRDSCQTTNWDKTQDEMDEARVGVG